MFVKLLILIICLLHPEPVPLWREENYQAQYRLLRYLHKFLSYLHKCDLSQMVGLDSSFLHFFLTEFTDSEHFIYCFDAKVSQIYIPHHLPSPLRPLISSNLKNH